MAVIFIGLATSKLYPLAEVLEAKLVTSVKRLQKGFPADKGEKISRRDAKTQNVNL